MDPVSNATRIAMLLRQRLEERSKSVATKRIVRGDVRGETGIAGKRAVESSDAVEGLNDKQLKRALIESILSDQLGAGLVNDARFQQVVDQVAEAFEDDGNGGALLAQVIADLRANRRA